MALFPASVSCLEECRPGSVSSTGCYTERQIDSHHGYIHFFWTLTFANGTELPGMDYGELAPDGKLAKIVGFF